MKTLITALFSLMPLLSFAQFISNVVGTGIPGYSGDGGPAVAAQIKQPIGITIDKAGNLYVVDWDNDVIRKITTAGVISTFAGDKSAHSPGDGGPATAAYFGLPTSVAIDATGNVYIADGRNNNIRKVDTAGIISTFAGDPLGTSDTTGDGGPAVNAKLNFPYGLAFDGKGSLYIADWQNNVVRRVDPSGIISRFAGNYRYGYTGDSTPATMTSLFAPYNVATDTAGNVYIAGGPSVRMVNKAGIISTFAGYKYDPGYDGDGGPASKAELEDVFGVTTDKKGNVYISDMQNSRIRKVNSSGIITTIAGTGVQGYSGNGGKAMLAEMSMPRSVAVDSSGNVYVADYTNSVIRKIDQNCSGPVLGQIMGAPRVSPSNTTVLAESSVGGVWSSADTSIATINSSGVVTAGRTCGPDIFTTIFYTASDSCTTSYSSHKIIIDFPEDVQNLSTRSRLHVAPNPTTNNIFVTLPQGSNEGDVYITDLNGRSQKQEHIATAHFSMNLSSLPTGMYIIRAITNAGVYQEKIIKL